MGVTHSLTELCLAVQDHHTRESTDWYCDTCCVPYSTVRLLLMLPHIHQSARVLLRSPDGAYLLSLYVQCLCSDLTAVNSLRNGLHILQRRPYGLGSGQHKLIFMPSNCILDLRLYRENPNVCESRLFFLHILNCTFEVWPEYMNKINKIYVSFIFCLLVVAVRAHLDIIKLIIKSELAFLMQPNGSFHAASATACLLKLLQRKKEFSRVYLKVLLYLQRVH